MHRSIRVHLACLAIGFAAAPPTVAQTSTADLDRDLGALHAQSHIPGLCIAVFDAGGVLYEKGFGFADLATKRPYTPQTAPPDRLDQQDTHRRRADEGGGTGLVHAR